MKKAIFLCVCSLITGVAYTTPVIFRDVTRIVSADELSIEKINELINLKNWDFTLEFKEGTNFPIKFLTKARCFSAVLNPNLAFKVDKKCYLRVVNKKCYLSEDLVEWTKAGKFFNNQPNHTPTLTLNQDETGFVVEASVR